MRVLFISAVLPYPLHSGGQVRIYNLLASLATRHDITLCPFIRHPEEEQYFRHLSFCKRIHPVLRGKRISPRYVFRAMTSTSSWLGASYTLPRMTHMLGRLLAEEQFDLIHAEPFYAGLSLPETDVPVVIGEHNVEFDVYAKYASTYPPPLRGLLRAESRRIRKEELQMLSGAAKVTVVSPEDKRTFSAITGRDNFVVVPNGVDTTRFRYGEFAGRTTDPVTLLFVGNFSWVPNLEAVQRILDYWPEISKDCGNVRMRIVGKHLPERLRRRAGSLSVELADSVGEIRHEYGAATALFAPLTVGGGSKFKILEAGAAGLPIITTAAGISGLDLENDTHVSVSEGLPGFIRAISSLRTDGKRWSVRVRETRKAVETKYDWKPISASLDAVWRSVR